MRYQYSEQVKEEESVLVHHQRQSHHIHVFQRVQMLRLFKSGQATSQSTAAALVGVTTRSIQTWWQLYLQQGLSGLLAVKPTRQILLDKDQQQALKDEAAKGNFSIIRDMRDWVKEHFSISYTEKGMGRIAHRLGIKKKTARPRHVKRDEEKAASFKKTSAN